VAVSVLRGFSAPVRLEFARDDAELAFLALHDSDGFSRWDAVRALQCGTVGRLRTGSGGEGSLAALYGRLIDVALGEPRVEQQALLAEMLALPSEVYLGDQMAEFDVDGVHAARAALATRLGRAHAEGWLELYTRYRPVPFEASGGAMARRALCNLALSFLCAAASGTPPERERLRAHLADADNLTDRLVALREILVADWLATVEREEHVEAFFRRWQSEKLVVDQWFSLQAAAPAGDALGRVERLERHAAFELRNPNRVRALYGTFCNQNLVAFHARDGSGYRFLAERVVALDRQNPQLAARVLLPMTRLKRYDAARQGLMRAALGFIWDSGERSPDIRELVAKSLADPESAVP
jgi:aminopeptidase N